VRLVDTGNLPFTDHIDRFGLEGGWKHGPWLVQSEYLAIDVARRAGRPDFSGDGFSTCSGRTC
jgi:phosphate-selective porin OprO/OprP